MLYNRLDIVHCFLEIVLNTLFEPISTGNSLIHEYTLEKRESLVGNVDSGRGVEDVASDG